MIPQPMSITAELADIKRRITNLESSPDLYGATITGSLFRTRSDGRRVEIGDWQTLVGNQISFYADDDIGHGQIAYSVPNQSNPSGTIGMSVRDSESGYPYGLRISSGSTTLDGSGETTLSLQAGYATLAAGSYPNSASIAVSAGSDDDAGSVSMTLSQLSIHDLPTISGKSPNLYIDPDNGVVSRIA